MIGRPYTIGFSGQTIPQTGEATIRLSAPADAILEIDFIQIWEVNFNSPGSGSRVFVSRGTSDGTGTSVTPKPVRGGDPAFGGTAIGDITANPTLGDRLIFEAWHFMGSYVWLPTPSERIVVSPSGRFVVGLDAAPGGDTTIFTTHVAFREIGG